MDGHYTQVMNARQGISEEGTRLYFAYSTILDREAFVTWRKQHNYDFFDLPEGLLAEAKGIDLIYDFPSRWWGGRVAGLTDKSGASVFGRLFSIAIKDWPIVQHKEGAITGMSIERNVTVLVDGKEFAATAFTTSPGRASLEGPVSEGFKEALIRGAQQAKLPESYIASLRK